MEREKIIHDDYPVENLPEDLSISGADRVRVTIEPQMPSAANKAKSWTEIKALIEKARSSPGFKPVTSEEAVARIRKLRDEWDR